MTKSLITGGSSGIGRAIALKLASKGNITCITGRDEEKLSKVTSEVIDKGGECYYFVGDVRNNRRAAEIVEKSIETMGGIDVLVANAGVGRFKNLEEFDEEDFDIQFNVNVKGVFNYLQPVVAYMKSHNTGQIIVTSSNLGFQTAARCSLYAATKFALQGMVGSLREELKGTGVKAGTLNPGSVDTPWFDGRGLTDERRKKMLSADDVADAALLMINQSERSDIDHILLHPGIK